MEVSRTKGGQYIGKMTKNRIVFGRSRELNSATMLQRLNSSMVKSGHRRTVVVGSVDTVPKVIDTGHNIRTQ